MKSHAQLSLLLPVIFLIVQSCGTKKSTEMDGYKATLKETQIEGRGFAISIPPDYTLQPTHGSDFDIFYFYPSDTTIRGEVAGGLYFGMAPGKFGPEEPACTVTSEVSDVLGNGAKWDVYSCPGKVSMETIIALNDSTKVHLFGSAKTASEAKKILTICSSLVKK